MLIDRPLLTFSFMILIVLMLTFSLSACGNTGSNPQNDSTSLASTNQKGTSSDASGTQTNASSSTTPSQKPTELIISAAVSLKDALETYQPTFEKEHHVKLNFNFGASGQLMQQIEQGAPVDVFISAGVKQMDELEQKGLIIPDTRTNVVMNTLVLVIPKETTENQKLSFDKLKEAKNIRLAMGEPKSVPAGTYAQEVLEHLGIYDRLTEAKEIVFANDVRQVLAYVETGEVDVGLVYKTDAAISDKVEINDTAQESWHRPIVYPGAVIQGTKEQILAKAFLKALQEGEGKNILEQYGFTPAP